MCATAAFDKLRLAPCGCELPTISFTTLQATADAGTGVPAIMRTRIRALRQDMEAEKRSYLPRRPLAFLPASYEKNGLKLPEYLFASAGDPFALAAVIAVPDSAPASYYWS